ncbi:hypothetical protein MRS44_003472 [Fusarium solani]|uniref:P-loop containing nucleoside triphosphate hydrolase protein n=1 Tax=Fusarium solani TaxID=169388 RepID=A0A9P9L2E6_FUSSL|nr:P-loop containing nucleoside triphosphate hydrolase protein [Fusarium solani]KAH7272972.1 P-loop containing nucleoside triphosphate hydrolase protein [Fusarium solani]KAJ3469407.1 hypothetical protein MRS44_003472 [Fusarium solani]
MRMPSTYRMPVPRGFLDANDDESDDDLGGDDLGGIDSTVQVGMTAETRDLYRKDCDDPWQEWAPEDIGVNANSAAAAAKFALIIRRQKHRDDDGELALALFSITVQSPLIKKQLGSVFDGYKGINTNLRKLDFKAPFHEFFYRWEEFVQAMPAEAEENEVSRSHYRLLFDTISKEMTPHIEQVTDLVKNNVISFQYVWALFEPGIEVYTRVDGHDRILVLLHGEYQKTDCGIIYNLSCCYVDTDGERFGYRNMDIVIQPFGNLRPILELDVIPSRLQPGIEAIRERLVERGQRFVALKGVHHRSYTGVYERANPPVGHPKKQHVVEERIVIDGTMFSKYVDEHQGRMPSLIPLDESPHGANSDIEKSLDPQIREKMGSRPQPPLYRMRQVNPSRGGRYVPPMPIPIMDTESRPVAPEDENLPDKYYHLCTHVVRGFCLKAKDWGYLDINLIQDIVWSNTAFDQLVLPHDYKRIIRAFVHAQISGLDNFDDVIKGKGRGIIMLLSGEPGTGKTLTSESVAETMHKPLYGMSAGELGDDAGEVEENLNRVLELSTKWRAVLLVDECDVFLERRSSSDLQRNKLVAIFLRLLEYYQGVMFLTTNRVSSFDPAFESRIHLTIHYPKLDVNSRLHVWNNFVKIETGGVLEAELEELAKEELNGRQIKNVVKTARLLASEEGVPLCSGHINTVLRIKRGNIKMD